MKKLVLFIFSLALLFYGCKQSTEPQPPEQKPPGYQEDVPWPSLADSPWPMANKDPQNSNRSKFKLPVELKVYKRVNIPTTTFSSKSFDALVIGDSSIYFAYTTYPDSVSDYFFAYSFEGKLQWKYPLEIPEGDHITSPPMVLQNRVILLFDRNGNMYRFSPKGDLVFKKNIGKEVFGQFTIGKGGIVYAVGRDKTVFAVNLSGDILWAQAINNPDISSNGGITFLPHKDNIIVKGQEGNLVSISSISGTINWETISYGYFWNLPLADSKNRIYFIPSTKLDYHGFYCIDSEDNLIFKNDSVYGSTTSANSAIDYNGNIYVDDGYLLSFNYKGELNWSFKPDSNPRAIICDANSNVYLLTDDSGNNCSTLYVINSKGTVISQIKVKGQARHNLAAGKDFLTFMTQDSENLINYLYILK